MTIACTVGQIAVEDMNFIIDSNDDFTRDARSGSTQTVSRFAPYIVTTAAKFHTVIALAEATATELYSLYIPFGITLTEDEIVPYNVELIFGRRGKLTLSTYDLTVKGYINAGPWEVFDNSSTGVLTIVYDSTNDKYHALTPFAGQVNTAAAAAQQGFRIISGVRDFSDCSGGVSKELFTLTHGNSSTKGVTSSVVCYWKVNQTDSSSTYFRGASGILIASSHQPGSSAVTAWDVTIIGSAPQSSSNDDLIISAYSSNTDYKTHGAGLTITSTGSNNPTGAIEVIYTAFVSGLVTQSTHDA